jgi:O-antigen ligase
VKLEQQAVPAAPVLAAAAARTPPRWLRWAMELVLLITVTVGPWLYGAVHPGFELLLAVGLTLLLALWALRILLARRVTLVRCPVTLLLAGILLIGLWQLTPLSPALLRGLSPATAQLYEELLPERQETPTAVAGLPPAPPAGQTLSLAPDATRNACYRLLAILLAFAVVRNNLGSTGVFTRLAFVAVLNGVALCLFALVQYFTSSGNTLYWTYPSAGRVFGPFVSKNLFPFYVNVCIGLGLGLLLARWREAEHGRHSRLAPDRPVVRRPFAALGDVVNHLLQDAASLWLLVGVALMAGTVAFSMSRGGFVALVGALGLGLVLLRSPSGTWVRVVIVVAVGGLTLLFLSWFGLAAVQERLGTLAEPDKADPIRVPLWLRVLPVVPEFPVWGTGLGTFEYVELWRRGQDPLDPNAVRDDTLATESLRIDHAHNDYLEILVEAGVPGLLLLLAALALVYRYGLHAVFRPHSRRTASLAVGGLCGLTAVAIHSVVDFGLRAPAMALLTAVVAALVCAVGSKGHCTRGLYPADEWQLRLGGVAPVAGALTLVFLGLLLCTHLWREHRVERLEAAALNVPAHAPDRYDRRIAYLQAAVRLAPGRAPLRMDLAQAYAERMEAGLARLDREGRLRIAADSVLLGGSLPVGLPASAGAAAWPATWLGRGAQVVRVQEDLLRESMTAAVANYVAARNACPLLPEAQLGLGLNAHRLPGAQAAQVYFRRAKFLAPRTPEVWYYSGLDHLARNELEPTWQDWRECLKLSDRYLDAILYPSVRLLKAPDLLAKVLPDRPERIVKAADRLFARADGKQAGADKVQAEYLRAALASLDRQEQPLSSGQLLLKARVQDRLGQGAEAEKTYRAVLSLDAQNAEARYELAVLLHRRKQDREAMRQVVVLLNVAPGHGPGRKLYEELVRQGVPP